MAENSGPGHSSEEGGRNMWARGRQLPKLMACAGKRSVENLQNELLFRVPTLSSNHVRRAKYPLHECLMWELEEAGYTEAAAYLRDLLADNAELLARDEIGIVVDLREHSAHLDRITKGLRTAEFAKSAGNNEKESLAFLEIAVYFSEQGKGILWLAEKLYLAAIAVAVKIMEDGGRQASCCKYYYGKFLLDKFPSDDTEEAFNILAQVRDACIGKTWRLGDGGGDERSVFSATASELHRILVSTARRVRAADPHRADRLCRTAERRAQDAEDSQKLTEAITELGISQLATNDLNNALRSFERALAIAVAAGLAEGICEGHMHVASALQRLGDYEGASKSLSAMGALSMKRGLRRQLGRALHLLGELHLRRARADLATPHLREAFNCFMGLSQFGDGAIDDFDILLTTVAEEDEPAVTDEQTNVEESMHHDISQKTKSIELLHVNIGKPAYRAEAEQSRLMMAVSSGQEKMASYFRLLIAGGECCVSRMQTLDWKLHSDGWWVPRRRYDLVPCPCPLHNRSPLDVLRMENERKERRRCGSSSLYNVHHVAGAKHLNLPEASWREDAGSEPSLEERAPADDEAKS